MINCIGFDLIKVLFQLLPGESEENNKKTSMNIAYTGAKI
jgi:hypothetical protein